MLATIKLEPVAVKLNLSKRTVAALAEDAIRNQTTVEYEAQALLDRYADA